MLMEKIMKMSKLAKKFTSVIIASALVFTLVNLPVVNADWVDNTSPQAAAVVGSYESFMPFAVTCDECCIGGCGYQDGVTIIQIIYGGRQNVQGPGFILFIVIPLPSGTITVPYFVSDPQDYESGAEITFPDIGVTIWLEFSGWGTLEEGDVLGDDSYVKYFPCECDYITCLCESCEATCIHVCEINHVICTGCNRCVPCDGCICTITVIKNWVGDDEHQDLRPDSVRIEVLEGGVYKDPRMFIYIEPDSNEIWYTVLEDLPQWRLYDDWYVSILYRFTVVENPVPPGYRSEVNGFVVTNTLLPRLDIDVTKEWVNDTNYLGFRPDDITVELRADGVAVETALLEGADGWAYRWIDLPRYSAPGVPIVYTVVELDVPAGYTSTAPSTAPAQVVITAGELEYSFTGTVTITNTFNREAAGFVDIVVDKVWVGDEEHLGFRPDSVEVELLADGAPMDPPRVVVLTQLVENWRHTWTDLPEFSAPGVPIVYHVVELNVPDWYTEYVTWNLDRTAFTVTNTFYQGAAGNRAAIAVEKVWVNDEDHLGFRPDYVWVEIRREDRPAWSLPLRLRADEDWTCAWPEGLPRYFGPGEEDLIVYYVVEVDIPVGYSTPDRAEGDVYVGFTVTNTFDPGAVGDGVIEVTKLWVGDGNNIDRRPETIVVELRREDRPGVVVARAVMRADADGNWVHVFTRVPVYKADGVEIVYYVAEINPPPRYRPTYSGNQVDGFVITNTFQADPIAPETGDLLSTTSLAALLLALSSMLSGTFLMRKRRRGES